MNENRKMTHVETAPGMGKEEKKETDRGGEFNYVIL
jgi:hypothetical protein